MTDLQALETLIHKCRRSEMRGQTPRLKELIGNGKQWFAVVQFQVPGPPDEKDQPTFLWEDDIWFLQPDSGEHGWQRWFNRSATLRHGKRLVTRMDAPDKESPALPPADPFDLLRQVAALSGRLNDMSARLNLVNEQAQRTAADLTLTKTHVETARQRLDSQEQWRRSVDHDLHALREHLAALGERVDRFPDDISRVMVHLMQNLVDEIAAIKSHLSMDPEEGEAEPEPAAAGPEAEPSEPEDPAAPEEAP